VAALPLGLIGNNPATTLLAGAAIDQAVSHFTPWLANDHATAVGDFLNGTGVVTERESAARAAVRELIAAHDPGLAASITEDQFNQIAYFYRSNLQTCTQIDLDDLEGY
jgi:selenocysteine lyase/cysteine desulfurase